MDATPGIGDRGIVDLARHFSAILLTADAEMAFLALRMSAGRLNYIMLVEDADTLSWPLISVCLLRYAGLLAQDKVEYFMEVVSKYGEHLEGCSFVLRPDEIRPIGPSPSLA
jgi:hypothetical protein